MAEELLASRGRGQPEMSMHDFCEQVIDDPQRYANDGVTKVVHHKRERDPENEFLVVSVLHGTETATLRVERGVTSIRPPTYPVSSRPLGGDRVSYWTRPPPNSTTMNSYEISTIRCREPIKLRNFCLVLRTVYSATPSYDLPQHESFVFCSVLMTVMVQELDVHELEKGTYHDYGGTYGGVKVLDEEIAARSMQDFRDQAEQDLMAELEHAIVDSLDRVRREKEMEQAKIEQAQAEALAALVGKQCKTRVAEEVAAEDVLTKIGERVKEKLALEKMEPVNRAIAIALNNYKERDLKDASKPSTKRINAGGGWERDEAREVWAQPQSPRQASVSLQLAGGRPSH